MFSIKLEKETYLADELATFLLKKTWQSRAVHFPERISPLPLQLSPCALTLSNPIVAPVGLRNELNLYTRWKLQ